MNFKGTGLYLSPFLTKEIFVPSKYNVSSDIAKRTWNGVVYDSAVEMKFARDYIEPRLLSGELVKAERQIKYILQPSFKHNDMLIRPINYVADFVITYADGHQVVIDIKGMPDATAKLKRKLFFYHYPDIDYQWISYSKIDGGWITYEALAKARKARKKQRELDKKGK